MDNPTPDALGETAEQASKLAFDTAWLRLRLSAKSKSPTATTEALYAMREATKHLALDRLCKLYGDVVAYHLPIAEIAAQASQTFTFRRYDRSADAANYIRRVIAAVVKALRPTQVVSSCR